MLSNLTKLPRKLQTLIQSTLRDLWMGLAMRVVVPDGSGEVLYRGLRRAEVPVLEKLYAELSGVKRLPLHLRCVYRIFGNRMVVVAIDESNGAGDIIGIDMFYFNDRDLRDRTIHEGFIGVIQTFRGRGIATGLRRCAIRSFRDDRIVGISTRIDIDNVMSMNSAINTGFKPLERYRDERLGVDRYYLVNYFRPLSGED